MNIAILVPRRDGVEDRDRLWRFARGWWENDYPDWPIVEGHHDVGPFNRSAAINLAAELAGGWDVALIIDSDVLCDPHVVKSAVDIAASTGAMVLAGNERMMLSKRGTEQVLGGFRGDWTTRGMVDRVYTDHCSCCIAVPRRLFDELGGFDVRHSGWGWEDVSFRVAAETMAGKPMVTLAGKIWHLNHLTSHENNKQSPLYKANEALAGRYRAAHWDQVAMRAILDEPRGDTPVAVELGESVIPRILFRTVPAETSDQVESWWTHQQQLHPGWEFRTYREPLDPADFPLTGSVWGKCQNGAQKAGLIRLEGLVSHGGVYVDSDVMPVRSFEPLVQLQAFAGWEDETTVPDAVLGARAEHPVFRAMLDEAVRLVGDGGDAWHSGPGVTTRFLPGRPDVLVLPPGAFFPHHYLQKNNAKANDGPWVFCRHMWHGSWLSPEHKKSIDRRQRR